MVYINCLGCKKSLRVLEGKESRAWVNHCMQTKCSLEKGFTFEELSDEEGQRKSWMRKELEKVAFNDANEVLFENVEKDDGEIFAMEGVPEVQNAHLTVLGEFSDEILDAQRTLASLGEVALDKFSQKMRNIDSSSQTRKLPKPDVADMMQVLKFGVDTRLSAEQGDRLMKLLNSYTSKHSANVSALPSTWKTMEDCVEECTKDMSFVRKYERPLDVRLFGLYHPEKTSELLKPFVGFMLNLKVLVGKMFLEMDLRDFDETFFEECGHTDVNGDHDRVLSGFSTGDLAKRFAEANKNYDFNVAEGSEGEKPVDVFINVSFDETSVSKVGTTSLTPTYFSIMNCYGKSYKYEVGGYLPYKFPYDDTFLKVLDEIFQNL